MDHDGYVVEFNPAAQQTFGYTREEAIGQEMAALIIPPSLREAHRTGLARYLQTGQGPALGRRLEITGMRKGGEEFPVELTITRLSSEEGAPLFTGFVRDITERKQAENALRQSQAELEDFFENSPVGLHWVDGNGIILRANRAEMEMLGYSPKEYIGQPIARFHADPDVIRDLLRRLAAGEELHSYEARLRCKDGSLRDVLISSNVLFENGRFIHTRCFTRDITERRIAEAQSARAAEEARIAAALMAEQQRRFLKDVLVSVTQGRLLLCETAEALPQRLAAEPAAEPIALTPQTLKVLRRQVSNAAAACGLSQERIHDVVTAVSECAMNAVQHAGGGIAKVYGDAMGVVQVWVEDQGKGIDLTYLPRATLERGYSTGGSGFGHGFWLMLQTCDQMHLLTGVHGTTVVLEQRRIAPKPFWMK
jgi:PAS domain S-box-containing protein